MYSKIVELKYYIFANNLATKDKILLIKGNFSIFFTIDAMSAC